MNDSIEICVHLLRLSLAPLTYKDIWCTPHGFIPENCANYTAVTNQANNEDKTEHNWHCNSYKIITKNKTV